MFQVLLCPCGYKTCGWQVKLCDSIKHGALLERFEDLENALYQYSYYITLHYITLRLNSERIVIGLYRLVLNVHKWLLRTSHAETKFKTQRQTHILK